MSTAKKPANSSAKELYYIYEKKIRILLIIVLLGVILVIYQNQLQLPIVKSDINSCKNFCVTHPQISGAVYGGVNSDGHCLCKISQKISNVEQNKNMDITVFVDVGIIEKATIE